MKFAAGSSYSISQRPLPSYCFQTSSSAEVFLLYPLSSDELSYIMFIFQTSSMASSFKIFLLLLPVVVNATLLEYTPHKSSQSLQWPSGQLSNRGATVLPNSTSKSFIFTFEIVLTVLRRSGFTIELRHRINNRRPGVELHSLRSQIQFIW